jgi:hypothetical protein
MTDFSLIYQSPQRRAQFASYALIAGIVVAVATILVSFWQIARLATGEVGSEEDLTPADGAQILVGLLAIGVSIATIVLFLLWFHRVARNLAPLGVRNQQYSPGWAVGSWFVPFANLFVPYRIAKEIWVKSDTNTETYGFLTSESTVPGFMGVWWGFWIVSNIAQNAATRLSFRASSPADLTTSEWVSIGAELLSIIAAIFVLQVIKDITARQEESATRLTNYGAPPPPPSYDTNGD